MLVLTQLSAGAFAALWIMDLLGRAVSFTAVLGSFGLVGISLNAAALHLGRPIHAWRALKGLRRSWLSREVLGLSLFAGAAAAFAAILLLNLRGGAVAGLLTVLCACGGITCSARIYMVPARPAWNTRYTIADFFATALLLGPMFVWAASSRGGDAAWLTRWAIAGATAQLLTTGLRFLWLARSERFELRASALLLSGRLKNLFLLRMALLIGAGVVLPLAARSAGGAVAAVALAVIGELIGRWLFFVSVVPKSVAAAFLATERAA